MLITVLNYTHTVINVFQLPYIFVIFMVFLYRLQCFNYASSFARGSMGQSYLLIIVITRSGRTTREHNAFARFETEAYKSNQYKQLYTCYFQFLLLIYCDDKTNWTENPRT